MVCSNCKSIWIDYNKNDKRILCPFCEEVILNSSNLLYSNKINDKLFVVPIGINKIMRNVDMSRYELLPKPDELAMPIPESYRQPVLPYIFRSVKAYKAYLIEKFCKQYYGEKMHVSYYLERVEEYDAGKSIEEIFRSDNIGCRDKFLPIIREEAEKILCMSNNEVEKIINECTKELVMNAKKDAEKAYKRQIKAWEQQNNNLISSWEHENEIRKEKAEEWYKYLDNNDILSAIEIANDVVEIDVAAFSNFIELKYVKVRGRVKTIANYAFHGCYSLEEVNLGNEIVEIGDCAFEGCESLIQIELPNSLKIIGNNVFSGTGLKEIEIPDSVQYIGEDAFENTSSTNDEDFVFKIITSHDTYAELYAKGYGYDIEYIDYKSTQYPLKKVYINDKSLKNEKKDIVEVEFDESSEPDVDDKINVKKYSGEDISLNIKITSSFRTSNYVYDFARATHPSFSYANDCIIIAKQNTFIILFDSNRVIYQLSFDGKKINFEQTKYTVEGFHKIAEDCGMAKDSVAIDYLIGFTPITNEVSKKISEELSTYLKKKNRFYNFNAQEWNATIDGERLTVAQTLDLLKVY